MPGRTPHIPRTRRLILLGCTGSIGRQTIEVVGGLNALSAAAGMPPAFEIVGLAAGSNVNAALAQAEALGVRDAAVCAGGEAVREARARGVNLRAGDDAAERLVREVECDVVLAAVVGAAGLPATLAAVERGVDVALANKETLVAAGALVVPAAQGSGARLLPVDSEHSAIWQCLPPACVPPCALGPEVRRIVLTASGGPFRTWPLARVMAATVEEALNHPTWKMGAKVTIDSASLTNKALEVIEAHWLFGLEGPRIDAVIHPQSIVHSFVEFADGSVLAQMGAPDMRTPIQYALTFPERPAGVSPKLDILAMSRLDFEPVDAARFPALGLAQEVIAMGGTAGAVFNAANEAAVAAFLERRIPFGQVSRLAEAALRSPGGVGSWPVRSLADVIAADAAARRFVALSLG